MSMLSALFRNVIEAQCDLPNDPDTGTEKTSGEGVSGPKDNVSSLKSSAGKVTVHVSSYLTTTFARVNLQSVQQQGVHVEGKVCQGSDSSEILYDVQG